MTANLPLIDLRTPVDPRQVDDALRTAGFLLVTDGGGLRDLQAAIRASAAGFFALPTEAKARYETTVSGRGWIPPGREANAYYGELADSSLSDLKESLTIGRELPGGDPEWFAVNVWPSETPELAGLCGRYTEAVHLLYARLLEVCAAALDLPADWFVRRCSRSPHTFNINRYPPRSETGPARPGQYRIAPHTDWGVLTFLDRQSGYGGLQIETADGAWEDAPWVEGAFTVNVGDLLARWSGGRWRSTRHRVLPPPAEAPDEELVSLILFLEADPDTVVSPISSSGDIGSGSTAGSGITAGDYLRERAAAATVA